MKKDIYAEIIKIVKRKSFLIINTILIVLTIILTIFNKDSSSKEISYIPKLSYSEFYQNNNGDYSDYLNRYEEYNKLLESDILKKEYIIKNEFIEENKIKNDLSVSYTMLVILSIYIVFLGSNSFGYEYDKNTIKLIMLNKYDRKKLVISKIISLFIISVFISITLYIVNLLTTFIINEDNVFFINDLIEYKGNIIEKSLIFLHTCEYFKIFIPLILLISLSQFLGMVLKSSTISSVISIVLLLSSSFITELLIKLKLRIVVYTFLPYLDFSIFLDKANLLIYNINENVNLNINYGIIIVLISSLVFIILSMNIFDKSQFK